MPSFRNIVNAAELSDAIGSGDFSNDTLSKTIKKRNINTAKYIKINCDFLIYNEKTLDYEFNLIHSWIISYIYNKYQRQGTVYYF